ncbi:TonB-dependent receptor [Qipengyuania sp. RANM35]|uniref:TonB-dependent receptor n=1 Tax=Qipengyuania sp. RANM35 TaxID=3068635 RepID=UPI0034DAF228
MEKRFFVLVLAGVALPGAAAAQDSAGDRPTDASRIIVTGERIPRTQADTASSVSLVSGDDAEKASADRLDQILALVPNVQLGTGEEGPAIRGQDSTGQLRNLFAFLGGARPRVTLQVDGRPVSFYEFISGSQSAWDIAQVEVFRSPQTTTQGRNSIAGAIFVTSKAPTPDWEGRARAIVGDFDTRQFSAMVSGPLVEDQIAFRASGDVRFSTVSSDMTDGIPGADIDRDDYGTARLKVKVTPTSLPGASVETTLAYTRSQAPQFEGVSKPFEDRKLPIPNQMIGVMKVEATSLTSRAEIEMTRGLRSTLTVSYGDAVLRRFGLPGLGKTRADTSDFSVEQTLRWQPSTAFDLVVGANRLTQDQTQSIDITGLGIGTGKFDDEQDSLGFFGEANWHLLPTLSLIAGLRYQRDRQIRVGNVGTIMLDYDRTFDAWLPKVSLAYEPNPDFTAGLLVQRAYNPGGTSISFRRRAEDSFEAEKLWNYELFMRVRSSDGRASFAANAFYNDISDAQRSQLVPFTLPTGEVTYFSEFANAPAARSYGLEAEIAWRVNDRLDARLGMGLLDTKVTETVTPRDSTLGKEFQRSPGLSAMAAIDWRPVDRFELSAQIRHHSSYYSDDANNQTLRISPSTILDARVEYEFGSVSVFGYARNLFDEFSLTYLITPNFGTAIEPREAGVGVEARF